MGRKIIIDLGRKKSKKSLKKGLTIGTAVGTALGAVAGILFAPKAGKELRSDLKEGAVCAAKKAASGASQVMEAASMSAKTVYKKLKKTEDADKEEETPKEENFEEGEVPATDEEVK